MNDAVLVVLLGGTALLLLGRTPVRPRARPRIVERLRIALIEDSACPDCLGPLRAGVCNSCGGDYSRQYEELVRPRCRCCKSPLNCCDICGMDWCLSCGPNTYNCPRCGRKS